MQADFIPSLLSTLSLVSLAEIGDKSQLVCMALATRYRHWPVLWGAAVAFMLLNLLAVVFGASVAAWLPEIVITGIVAIMFIVFGIQAIKTTEEDEEVDIDQNASHSIFITTFLMILLSEFGDKTQIAVAGLSTTLSAVPVWIGASIALIAISALGIWAGKSLTGRVPMHWLHRIGGVLFLTFAVFASVRFVSLLS
jgi:putative Ca2+/H+ antiporter (TMEM165/GDT1 family)